MISAVYHNTGPIRSQRYNDDYEILFVEEGQIELTVGEKVYVAGKNSITLLNNLEQQGLRLRKNGECSRYCIYFRAPVTDTYIRKPELLNLLKNRADLFQHCVDVTPIREQVLELIRQLCRCEAEKPYANDLAAAYLTQLLILISRLHPALVMNHLRSSCKKRIYAVQRYLDLHFQEQLLIADVCEKHYISSHYLSHQFKDMTGYSPKQYLTLVRLKHAAAMLCNTALSVNEIAYGCGFSGINNFCKQLKKNTAVHQAASVCRIKFLRKVRSIWITQKNLCACTVSGAARSRSSARFPAKPRRTCPWLIPLVWHSPAWRSRRM